MAESRVSGQELVERVEAFIRSYVVFPEGREDASLVAALWAVNTWIYQVWSSTPYLSIQAATPGAGKSTLLECVAAICRNAELVAEPTAASLYRLADSYKGWMTVCYDDAQKLGLASSRAFLGVMLPGYRRGATVPRTVPVSEANPAGVTRFPVYWPKAFSLIGDLVATLRDRSIIIPLERATRHQRERAGVKVYMPDEMHEAADVLVPLIGSWIKGLGEERPGHKAVPGMDGREQELWMPLFSTLHLLDVDAATLKRFRMIAQDLSALKSEHGVVYTANQQVEDAAQDRQYAERAVAHLAAVLRDEERGISSAVAVQRMRALPDGPWRTYKGGGLNEVTLSGLVARFDLAPAPLPRARGEKQVRGYRRADITKAAKL